MMILTSDTNAMMMITEKMITPANRKNDDTLYVPLIASNDGHAGKYTSCCIFRERELKA